MIKEIGWVGFSGRWYYWFIDKETKVIYKLSEDIFTKNHPESEVKPTHD